MKNLFSVSGKVAVITGGSRGIGAMMARGFVENGVKTYITARKADELNVMAAQLSALGGAECIPVAADLSTMEGIELLTGAVEASESRIDILINNAGATWGEELESFPEAGWDKVMDLNVKSPFFLIQKLLPLLKAGANKVDPARVINIASINAFANSKMTNYSYTASKAAVVQMTRHLAADLAKENITVNGIAPGLFPSNMTDYMISGHEEEIDAAIPRGRIGSSEDIAGTAIYLSSRASAWMTGHSLILDCGVIATAG